MKRVPFLLLCCLLGALASMFAAAARMAGTEGVVWLEAEQFVDCGGWSNDPEYTAQMGSPYLMATGVGKPVADAVTKAHVPRPGRYRLWVRCKDWYPPRDPGDAGQVGNPSYSPGRFQVLVAGRASTAVFGQARDSDWRWVDGGEFDLEPVEVEIRLHDLTGWWGRCDAIVLSGDKGFRPADDLEQLAKQREAYGGVSREVKQLGPYDVVVVGGGLAGSAAAIAAARLGCRVALIQDRPVLGGNASTEIGVPPEGDTTREPLDPRETGIIEEFDPKGERYADWSTPIEKVVRSQSNLDLFLNTRATGVAMRDMTTIETVEALDVRAGTRYRFAGRMFIDCTGDGWIGFWAGAEYRHGSESRDEHGETIAGEQANRQTMGNTLYTMHFRTHDKPVAFEAPPWLYQWKSPDDFDKDPINAYRTKGERPRNWDNLEKGRGREPKRAGGGEREWWIELGGMQDTIQDAEAIRDELLRINISLWNYVKNHHPKFKEENENKELVWINYIPGKRESRRLVGDYVMTQRDYAERIVHRDTVAYCGWGTDIHHPWGFFSHGNLYYSGFHHKQSIPYRCLYSRNISNLLMAGRDVSVSHIALGSVRVMRTCCIMGQAAGTAAAIAAGHYTTPRGVYEKHLDELQDQLLKDGAYLMDRPNRDPRDLARAAKVSASSVATILNPRLDTRQLPNGGLIHHLETERAVMFTATSKRLDSVALHLRSDLAMPTSVQAVLRPAEAFGDFSATRNLAKARATVSPMSDGWIEFKLRATLEPGKFYYIALPRSMGLSWHLYPYEPKGTTRAYGGPRWKQMYGCYKFRLDPGGEPPEPQDTRTSSALVRLAPENAINGWNRAVEGNPNSWSPIDNEPLPQWIELKFEKAVRFNAVHVTFQLAAMAAPAYRIETSADGKDWQPVVQVADNMQRRRVHSFKPVTADRVRLVIVERCLDGGMPRICEIRMYDEPQR